MVISSTMVLVMCLFFWLAGAMGSALGFGFAAAGAVAMVWLGPEKGLPLLLCLSILNLGLSIKLLNAHMVPIREWSKNGYWNYFSGGVLGVPLGLLMLFNLSTIGLKFSLGLFLMICAIYFIIRPHRDGGEEESISHKVKSFWVGVLGGVAGGFAAFPNAPVVAWLRYNNVDKAKLVSITQPFALSMQLFALALLTVIKPSVWSNDLLNCMLWAAPATIAGTVVGVYMFRSFTEKTHANVIGWALGLCAISVVVPVSYHEASEMKAVVAKPVSNKDKMMKSLYLSDKENAQELLRLSKRGKLEIGKKSVKVNKAPTSTGAKPEGFKAGKPQKDTGKKELIPSKN